MNSNSRKSAACVGADQLSSTLSGETTGAVFPQRHLCPKTCSWILSPLSVDEDWSVPVILQPSKVDD